MLGECGGCGGGMGHRAGEDAWRHAPPEPACAVDSPHGRTHGVRRRIGGGDGHGAELLAGGDSEARPPLQLESPTRSTRPPVPPSPLGATRHSSPESPSQPASRRGHRTNSPAACGEVCNARTPEHCIQHTHLVPPASLRALRGLLPDHLPSPMPSTPPWRVHARVCMCVFIHICTSPPCEHQVLPGPEDPAETRLVRERERKGERERGRGWRGYGDRWWW
jgi:hypothetical protein